MGQRPTLKKRARSLARRQTAMQLLAKGEPITAIAEQLCVTTRQVRFYLTAALETESFYPNNLTPERIAELRQLEGEKLTYIWGKLHESFEKSQAKDGAIRARLAEASSRISERISRLFGLDMPLKIQEEQFRLSVTKIDQKVTISWDQNMLAAPTDPVPGLFIGGRTPLATLDSGAVAVPSNRETARDGPQNGTEVAIGSNNS